MGVLYHFRRRFFFRDLGIFPLPYKRTLRVFAFTHLPVLWKFCFEYVWGDSLYDRKELLGLVIDELSAPSLGSLYADRLF